MARLWRVAERFEIVCTLVKSCLGKYFRHKIILFSQRTRLSCTCECIPTFSHKVYFIECSYIPINIANNFLFFFNSSCKKFASSFKTVNMCITSKERKKKNTDKINPYPVKKSTGSQD